MKGCNLNVAGLIFTEEEDAISGWVNRSAKDIKCKIPTNFDELEKFDGVHTLDVDIINADTKTLHHSAHLFFEKQKSRRDYISCYTNLLS